MFVDRAIIFVRSGKGGDGHVSFRRAKYIPKGGPDGGDGGHGGHVDLVATAGIDTLQDQAGRHHWYAQDGQPGGPRQRFGAKGDGLEIRVPPGTLVYDEQTGDLLDDLSQSGQRLRVAKGGRGGYGNEHFKSAVNQTPREFTPGESHEERTLRLELKLIADVGLIGLPNAGKSTLLSRISQARPKIADYPFTTLHPNLGIAELTGFRRIVVADIPGLIEGAHQGHGLGIEFLRHIERTRCLIHVVDASPTSTGSGDNHNAIQSYHIIRQELARYSSTLAQKPEVVALNKIDLFVDEQGHAAAHRNVESATDRRVFSVSGVTGKGLRPLLEMVWSLLDRGGS